MRASAPPRACTARAAISTLIVGASAHAAEAPAKTTMPATHSGAGSRPRQAPGRGRDRGHGEHEVERDQHPRDLRDAAAQVPQDLRQGQRDDRRVGQHHPHRQREQGSGGAAHGTSLAHAAPPAAPGPPTGSPPRIDRGQSLGRFPPVSTLAARPRPAAAPPDPGSPGPHRRSPVPRRGYQAVSVNPICAETGVLKGSFYHYFPSKRVLAIAVIDHLEVGLRAPTGRPRARRHAAPIAKMRATPTVVAEIQRSPEAVLRARGGLPAREPGDGARAGRRRRGRARRRRPRSLAGPHRWARHDADEVGLLLPTRIRTSSPLASSRRCRAWSCSRRSAMCPSPTLPVAMHSAVDSALRREHAGRRGVRWPHRDGRVPGRAATPDGLEAVVASPGRRRVAVLVGLVGTGVVLTSRAAAPPAPVGLRRAGGVSGGRPGALAADPIPDGLLLQIAATTRSASSAPPWPTRLTRRTSPRCARSRTRRSAPRTPT